MTVCSTSRSTRTSLGASRAAGSRGRTCSMSNSSWPTRAFASKSSAGGRRRNSRGDELVGERLHAPLDIPAHPPNLVERRIRRIADAPVLVAHVLRDLDDADAPPHRDDDVDRAEDLGCQGTRELLAQIDADLLHDCANIVVDRACALPTG